MYVFVLSIFIGIIIAGIIIIKSKNHFFSVNSNSYEHFINILYYLYSIITEELYFRAYLISYGKTITNNAYLIILFSSLFFVFSHYLNRWANVTFTLKIYIFQFLLAVLLAIFYYYTSSILYCIIIHFCFNIEDFINEFYMIMHNDSSFFED